MLSITTFVATREVMLTLNQFEKLTRTYKPVKGLNSPAENALIFEPEAVLTNQNPPVVFVITPIRSDL